MAKEIKEGQLVVCTSRKSAHFGRVFEVSAKHDGGAPDSWVVRHALNYKDGNPVYAYRIYHEDYLQPLEVGDKIRVLDINPNSWSNCGYVPEVLGKEGHVKEVKHHDFHKDTTPRVDFNHDGTWFIPLTVISFMGEIKASDGSDDKSTPEPEYSESLVVTGASAW